MDPMELLLKNVVVGDKARLMKKGFAEVVFRDGNGRIETIKKMAIGQLKGGNNGGTAAGAMGKLGIALQVANIVATIACTVIICGKLNKVDQKLDAIRQEISDLKDINFETQIAHPCRELLGDYKLLGDKLKKNKPVTEEEFITLIRGLHNYLVSIYNLSSKLPMDTSLDLMLTLLPVYTNCIMLYYQRFYDIDQGKHVLHDDWLSIYDMLSSVPFLRDVQDYLFVDKRMTNRETNEFINTQRAVVTCYKQKVEQLLADLETCEGVKGYEEAMCWSRQYAAQQAKAVQEELEEEYGVENAQPVMKKMMQEVLA